MSADIDLKACSILERLSAELSDATVDYCCTQDLHEFQITRAGVKHEVGFMEAFWSCATSPTSSTSSTV